MGEFDKYTHNFGLAEGTTKIKTFLESWNIRDSKNMHEIYVALTIQKLRAFELNSEILIRIRYSGNCMSPRELIIRSKTTLPRGKSSGPDVVGQEVEGSNHAASKRIFHLPLIFS